MPKPTQARISPAVFRPGPLTPVPYTVYKETPGPVHAAGGTVAMSDWRKSPKVISILRKLRVHFDKVVNAE